MDYLDLLDQREIEVLTEYLDSLGLQDHQEKWALKGCQDWLDHQV